MSERAQFRGLLSNFQFSQSMCTTRNVQMDGPKPRTQKWGPFWGFEKTKNPPPSMVQISINNSTPNKPISLSQQPLITAKPRLHFFNLTSLSLFFIFLFMLLTLVSYWLLVNTILPLVSFTNIHHYITFFLFKYHLLFGFHSFIFSIFVSQTSWETNTRFQLERKREAS